MAQEENKELKKGEKFNDDTEIFKQFDEADEEQIEAQLKGAVAEDMVYSFDKGGAKIEGLSATGTMAAMDAYNEVLGKKGQTIIVSDKDEAIIAEGNVFYKVFAEIVNKKGLVIKRWPGSANQPLKQARRMGEAFDDPFAFPKATTKASRNAVRGLLPDSLVKKLIEKWSKQKKVKTFFSQGSAMNLQSGDEAMYCDKTKGGCGRPLTQKAREYYAQHPDKDKLCYMCNQKLHPR